MRQSLIEQQFLPKNRSFTARPDDSRWADLWAVILADRDGARLRPLTRRIAGNERPRQFRAVSGREALLDQTRSRVALAVRPAQTFFVLTRTHERFYEPLLGDVPRERLVVQPKDAGTAPAVLYGLMRMWKKAPLSTVAFFPSDHYLSDDLAFMSYVESAHEVARSRADMVILLGIKPEGPEAEYGWIEPVSPDLINSDALCRVRHFWEKPGPRFARTLMERGCLWNSSVMVGRVSAFLKMYRRALPYLYTRFHDLAPVLNTADETGTVAGLYSQLSDVIFSREVLAARAGDLAVLPVGGLRWSDPGRPRRILSAMADIDV